MQKISNLFYLTPLKKIEFCILTTKLTGGKSKKGISFG
jgi:hypothetical protein